MNKGREFQEDGEDGDCTAFRSATIRQAGWSGGTGTPFGVPGAAGNAGIRGMRRETAPGNEDGSLNQRFQGRRIVVFAYHAIQGFHSEDFRIQRQGGCVLPVPVWGTSVGDENTPAGGYSLNTRTQPGPPEIDSKRI
jgi:hypothetical protein